MSSQASHQVLKCANVSDVSNGTTLEDSSEIERDSCISMNQWISNIYMEAYRKNFQEIEKDYFVSASEIISNISSEVFSKNFRNIGRDCSVYYPPVGESISNIYMEAYRKNFGEIEPYFKEFFCLNEIRNLQSFALDILNEVYNYLATAEKKLHYEGIIKRKNHLYPLDMLLLFNNTETSEKRLKMASIATTFFYMLSHFTDDYVDNRSKIFSEFIEKDYESHYLIEKIIKIYYIAFKEFTRENFSRKSSLMLQEAFKYKFCKLILKLKEMIGQYGTLRNSSDEFPFLIRWKAYELSGLMYSFLSDVIFHTMDVCTSMREYIELSEATRHLGCLCQLTDDLRDFEKDIEQGEINIFCTMIRDLCEENKEDHPRIIFYRLFENEINEILKRTEKLNLSIDRERLILLSSYPFFMNDLRLHFSDK